MVKKFEKVAQKSTFIISLAFRDCDTTVIPAKVKSHDVSILCLTKLRDVIEFLERYTNFSKHMNNDVLAMKLWLKEHSTFVVDIADWNRLENDILMTEYIKDPYEHMLKFYPEHMIEVRRVPLGIQKRRMNPDYIE